MSRADSFRMGTLLWSGRFPVRRKRELVVAFQLARRVASFSEISDSHVTIKGEQFARDEMTNITPRILSHLDPPSVKRAALVSR